MGNLKLAQQAVSYFEDEYLCSQSVLMAYAPLLGINLKEAVTIAAPFGAGISRMGWTCGAVTGALMVIGLRCGHEVGGDAETKENMYKIVREFIAEFDERYGSVECRKLLGRNISVLTELEAAREERLFDTICPGYVRGAVEILEEIMIRE